MKKFEVSLSGEVGAKTLNSVLFFEAEHIFLAAYECFMENESLLDELFKNVESNINNIDTFKLSLKIRKL